VIVPQGQRSVDILLLTLLAATTKQNNNFQTVFRKIDAITRPSINFVLTNAPEPFDVRQVALLHSCSCYADLGCRYRIQRFEPFGIGAGPVGEDQFFDLVAQSANGNI
ncbi:MAG: hypothetical protein WCY47_08225, partial [Pusillimonas sp.]